MTNILDSLAKPPPEPSEIDRLVSTDPLDLTSDDIDKIIAMQRQQRARREAGVKVKKSGAEAPKHSLDLAALGLTLKAPTPPAPLAPGFRRL